MKLKRILIFTVLCAGAGGAYWKVTEPLATDEASRERLLADPQARAISEMAKFLATAPAGQLKAMKVANPVPVAATPADPSAPWNGLLPYVKRAENGVWVAQMLTSGSPLGTDQEARKLLLENPTRSFEDVGIVLGDLPESFTNERSTLLSFVRELGEHMDDPSVAATALLKESQRNSNVPLDTASDALVPQAVALAEYYQLVGDRAKRYEAFKAAMDSQTDPAVKLVLKRFEVPAPGGRSVASETQSAPQAAQPPGPGGAQPAADTQAAPAAAEEHSQPAAESQPTAESPPAAESQPAADPQHPADPQPAADVAAPDTGAERGAESN